MVWNIGRWYLNSFHANASFLRPPENARFQGVLETEDWRNLIEMMIFIN